MKSINRIFWFTLAFIPLFAHASPTLFFDGTLSYDSTTKILTVTSVLSATEDIVPVPNIIGSSFNFSAELTDVDASNSRFTIANFETTGGTDLTVLDGNVIELLAGNFSSLTMKGRNGRNSGLVKSTLIPTGGDLDDVLGVGVIIALETNMSTTFSATMFENNFTGSIGGRIERKLNVPILLSVDTSTAGTLVVTGIAGSVDANATVTIKNTTANETIIVTADATGAFTGSINGNDGDLLNFIVTEAGGEINNGIPYTVGIIQIVSPSNSAQINDNEVNVYGTFSGESNAGINVNGEMACTYNNNFYVNNLPLTTGINTLTATYTTQSGDTQNAAINVTQSGSTDYKFSADQNCGLAPVDVAFDLDAGSNIIQQLDIDYDADGTIDLSTTTPTTAILQHTYTTPGVYPVIAWVTSGGITQPLYLNIVVNDKTQQDGALQAVWGEMWDALKAGDKPRAMQYLTPEARKAYDGIFDSLMPFMTETFDELSAVQPIESNNETEDFAVIRLENGAIKTYIINYKRGNDGVWRIDSM